MTKSNSAWGWHAVGGVEFFLEPTHIPPLCPVPTPRCDCPHKTDGAPQHPPFRTDVVYLASTRPEIPGVVWDDDVFYFGPKSFKQIEERAATSRNYVPLVVHNLRAYDKTEEVFRRALSVAASSSRPIVFVSADSDWIIAPSYVVRLGSHSHQTERKQENDS